MIICEPEFRLRRTNLALLAQKERTATLRLALIRQSRMLKCSSRRRAGLTYAFLRVR
jgi:hypothetical protein